MIFFFKRINKKVKLVARKKTTPFIILTTLFLIFFGSLVMKLIEPEKFPTYFDALWYVCITLTTVGYGDFYPSSVEARIAALILLFSGLGVVTLSIGKILDFFSVRKQMREEGRMKFKGEDHLIIIGWSEKARKSIEEALRAEKKEEIVIIDKEIEKDPFPHERVHFIKGVPSHEETMEMANITKAKSVIVFGNEKINAEDSDAASMMVATRVEKMAPRAKTIVEIMDERNKGNFEHIKVDEFIFSHETVSHLAVLAAFSNGITKAFSSLLTVKDGDEMYTVSKRSNWKTYRDAFIELLEEGATLFANGDDTSINRKLNEEIPNDAQLVVICDKKTAKKINKK